ncbi:unnamed protein product [Polarella glacialis]|uniref:Uncharacterized protein n=2 Tax=Polarella glacialis TaxID=89957 RepID=A0A813LB83_POLGL|nr:unnamed protein product [Polarella glacialis]
MPPPVPGFSSAMSLEEASYGVPASSANSHCGGNQQSYAEATSADWQQPRLIDRRLSSRSVHQIEQLGGFERQFTEIDHAVDSLEAALVHQQIAPSYARDHLAQLEARLDKLQCHGVDSIDTVELQSGRLEAKSLRKGLTHRGEAMHERMEEIFRRLKHMN